MDLLAAYDAQVRTALARRPPRGVTCEWVGPLLRCSDVAYRGFAGYRSLAGEQDVDALIARTVAFFGARGEAFEWKADGHDQPADLPDRLRAHGFVPEDVETVMIGETTLLARDPLPPEGDVLREVTQLGDFRRIADLESAATRRAVGGEVSAGRRFRRQPPDPGTARLRPHYDDDAVCVDAAAVNSRRIIAQPVL